MNKIEKMEAYLNSDAISIKTLETFFEVGFKMEINPLPLFRKWLKRNNIDVEIHFSDKSYNDVMMKGNKNKKHSTLVVVRAVKGECGCVENVHIHTFPEKESE